MLAPDMTDNTAMRDWNISAAVTHTRRRRAGVFVAAVCLSACGSTDQEAVTARPIDAPAETIETPDASPDTSPATTPESEPASTPTTTLAEPSSPFDLANSTVDSSVGLFGDDYVEAVGGEASARELASLAIGTARWSDDHDDAIVPPLDVLEPYLPEPVENWTFAGGDADPVPVPGTPCQQGWDDLNDQNAERCEIERRTLEVAADAYVLDNPESPPPNEDDVVGVYLREPVADWDLVDGEIIAAPGSPCEQG